MFIFASHRFWQSLVCYFTYESRQNATTDRMRIAKRIIIDLVLIYIPSVSVLEQFYTEIIPYLPKGFKEIIKNTGLNIAKYPRFIASKLSR